MNLDNEIFLRASGACPRTLGELPVPRLGAMDMEMAGNSPCSMERPDEPAALYNKDGLMAMLVGDSFLDEVNYKDDRDALVYFAFLSLGLEFDSHLGAAVTEVSHDVAGPELLVGFMNMDCNTVPDPFGTYIKAPCLIYFRRGNKFKPVILKSFHGSLSEEVAKQILEVVDHHTTSAATKEAVFIASTKKGILKAKDILKD